MTDAGGAEQLAAGLGIRDALIFRRVSASSWVHLGGIGRGRGWAGLVDVDARDDLLAAHVPTGVGGVHRFATNGPERVLGPYYARGGALVRVSRDVLVLLGHPTALVADGTTDDDLRGLAEALDAGLDDIAPSKRLGDELEVLHAIRAVTTLPATDLTRTLQHVLAVAVQSLSCEVGVLRDGAGHLVTTVGMQRDAALAAALDDLEDRTAGSDLCLQETDAETRLGPFGRPHGVRSVLALPLPAPVGGILVVGHVGARGFTSLCQELGSQVAVAAGVVAHTAALREELHAALAEQAVAARRDPLTGLGNRLAWDEALAAAQDDVDAGGAVAVITVDVDGLKLTNDTWGHEAGDGLLRACAAVIRSVGRVGDVAVRLGGDEFALLVPCDEQAPVRTTALRDAFSGARGVVSASVGTAAALPGGSVADAVREADADMYAAKRARRATAHAPARQPTA